MLLTKVTDTNCIETLFSLPFSLVKIILVGNLCWKSCKTDGTLPVSRNWFGSGGVGGGGVVTSYIRHSTEVHAEWPHFSGIWLAPFFRQKVYDWPIFLFIFFDWYMKGPTFSDIPVYAHIFHSDFWGCLFSWYSMNWLHYLSTTSNKWVQKNQWAVYEWVNISDGLVYEWVCFFKGQVYEWGRFRNTGSHTRTKIITKLPPPRVWAPLKT